VLTLRNPQSKEELEQVCRLTTRFLGGGEEELRFALMMRAYESCPFHRPEMCFLFEIDGEIAASFQGLELPMQVGNATVQAIGLQGLVVDPRFRNRGLATRLFAEARRVIVGRGLIDVAVGFGHPRLYDQVGATPVMGDTEATLDVKRVRGPRPKGFQPMEDGEVELLLDHYASSNQGRVGIIRRSPEYWAWLFRRPPSIRIRKDGYLGYEVREDGVILTEVGGEDAGFYHDAALELAALAREAGLPTIVAQVPPDHPFVEACFSFGVELRTVHHRTGWCMGEVTALGPFLEAIRPELERRQATGLPGSPGTRLRIRLNGEVEEMDLQVPGGETRELEIGLSRKLFTQLAFGYKGARTVLSEAGCHPSESELLVLDALFPRGNPYIWKADRF
jgi:GNAT superfamily N-acetyltransferase